MVQEMVRPYTRNKSVRQATHAAFLAVLSTITLNPKPLKADAAGRSEKGR